jgi:hypothetical protein
MAAPAPAQLWVPCWPVPLVASRLSGDTSTTHAHIETSHSGESATTAHLNHALIYIDRVHREAHGVVDANCYTQMHAPDWSAFDRSITDTNDTLQLSPSCTTFSDLPHPATLLPPLDLRTLSGSTACLMLPWPCMSERHESAAISPPPGCRLAAHRPHAPTIRVDSPFPRLCVRSGGRVRRRAGRERRVLLRADMHGAYAGITPGHTDHRQRGVWLTVGHVPVFCILQR